MIPADILLGGYLGFLRRSNGGEGEAAHDAGCTWLQIWPAENVLRIQSQLAPRPPYLWPFASDGGGELFAFDLRDGSTGEPAIVMIPAIGAQDESQVIAAAVTWAAFESGFGRAMD